VERFVFWVDVVAVDGYHAFWCDFPAAIDTVALCKFPLVDGFSFAMFDWDDWGFVLGGASALPVVLRVGVCAWLAGWFVSAAVGCVAAFGAARWPWSA